MEGRHLAAHLRHSLCAAQLRAVHPAGEDAAERPGAVHMALHMEVLAFLDAGSRRDFLGHLAAAERADAPMKSIMRVHPLRTAGGGIGEQYEQYEQYCATGRVHAGSPGTRLAGPRPVEATQARRMGY